MVNPKKPGRRLNLGMIGIGSIIGCTLIIALRVLFPEDPATAVLTVVCAGLVATLCMTSPPRT